MRRGPNSPLPIQKPPGHLTISSGTTPFSHPSIRPVWVSSITRYARRKLLGLRGPPQPLPGTQRICGSPIRGQGPGGHRRFRQRQNRAAGRFCFVHHPATIILRLRALLRGYADSASVDGFLRRLLGELKRLADIKEDTPTTSEKMREALPLWLAQTRSGRPIVLVLDALNQIQGDQRLAILNWLPRFFPVHIRVVASSLSLQAEVCCIGRKPPREPSRRKPAIHTEGKEMQKRPANRKPGAPPPGLKMNGLAAAAGVPKSTILYYASQGLLPPAPQDEPQHGLLRTGLHRTHQAHPADAAAASPHPF